MGQIVAIEDIEQRIYFIRGVKVMLDRDLASLYEVEKKFLKRNVKRHIKRFPADFMFELSYQEFMNLRRQFGTSNRGGTRYMPMAFTEQRLAMLSGILNSDRAVEVNIQIMRVFVKLRQMVLDHAELKRELEELRNQTDERFQVVFTVLDKLVNEGEEEKRKIGFIENGVKKC
jgi:hypothetical protein